MRGRKCLGRYEIRITFIVEKDVSIFGWPKQAKYVLYSAAVDGSLIRNIFTFQMSQNMGQYPPLLYFWLIFFNAPSYATRSKYVELFLAPTNSTDVFYPTHYYGICIRISLLVLNLSLTLQRCYD